VKASVAIALGLGTMIGWKRIVVTVGEKIGKEHLTYGQGAAAEITAMGTIGLADSFGLPVSTTCAVVRRRGHNGGKWFRHSNVNRAQHPARLGLHVAVCDRLISLSLRCVPANIVNARFAGC
jgi:hypothetical protein